jgi:hypothetical protein
MSRLIAIFALAAALSGCAGSSPFTQTPVSGVAPAASAPYPNLPRSQYECVTDEGYGRWVPCGNKS